MPKQTRTGGREAPMASDDRRRPEVIVDFVFESGLFEIAVENIGERPALDVRVRFEPAFRGAGGEQKTSELRLFRGIPFLAPRRRIVTFLDASAAYFSRNEPTTIVATVSYADRSGAVFEDVIRHDLEIYRDLLSVARPSDSV